MNRPVVMLTNAILEDKEGGLYRYVSELSAALARRGVDVTVLTKKVTGDAPDSETTPDGVRIERYWVPSKSCHAFALLYPLVVFAAVRRALRRHPGAVVHAHFPVPALVPLLTRRPYLYTFHSPVYRELLGERQGSYALPAFAQRAAVSGLRTVEGWLLRRASRVVLLSEFSRAGVAVLDRAAARSALLLPGGVDTEHFRPADGGELRPHGEGAWPLIVVARRLVWQTGVLETVLAMPKILAAYPGARLVVLGDGLFRPEIEQRIRESGLDDHVELRGHVGNEVLLDWYRRATMVVMPTQELEGFGLVSAEAMACGTPVVATPVGANPEVVGSLDAVLMAASTEPEAIGSVVLTVTREIEDGLWPQERVRAHVAPRFSWEAVADAHESLYDGERQGTHR